MIDGEIKKLPLKKLNLKEVEVAFESDPVGAEVMLLDGEGERPVGQTPCTYTIDPSGDYRVKFLKRGYEAVDRKIEVEEGQSNVTVFAKLSEGARTQVVRKTPTKTAQRAPVQPSEDDSEERVPAREPKAGGGGGAGGGGFGTLSVQTRPWSKVFINGEFIKNTPLVNYKLKAGTYRVTVENTDYSIKKEFNVTIRADQQTTLVRRLI